MSGTKELADQLAAIANQLGMQLNGGGAPAPSGWKKPAAGQDGMFIGVSVPIKVETPMGSVKCHLALPPEVASSLEAMMNAIKQLHDMGLPIDFYQPKSDGWQRGGGNGGGWQNRNGGYNNNGYGRRW